MDFALTDFENAYVEAVRGLADRLGNDKAAARDAEGGFSHAAWRRLAGIGLTGLPAPEPYGGQQASAVATVAALAELGAVCVDNGLMFALGAHLWACLDPIVGFGSEAQKRRWLPGLCDGTLIGAHAASEAEAGSDAAAIRTAARRDGDDWVLDGVKNFVTNAPVADLFLVSAVTDPARGPMGISAFLVPRDAPGLTVGPAIEKSGLRTAPMAQVMLEQCRIPDDALLGQDGAGMSIFTATMTRERTFILAPALGVMDRLAAQCDAYARSRRQFGAPIADFQAVSHRIAEMKLRAQTARLLACWTAWLHDTRQARPHHAAMVKLHLAESLLASALDAVQIHGGYGYATELELERMVRDAMGARLYSGTSDIQRNVIARSRTGAARAGSRPPARVARSGEDDP